jgi:uncharacterized protein
MSLSMYQAGIPVAIRFLNNLSAILDKAVAHCTARNIDPTVLVNFRLAPDMLPFSRQIQIATDIVKGGAARLAGVEVPSYADTEASFDELKARIAKTVAFLQTFKPAQIDGSEGKEIVLKLRNGEMKFTGVDYLTNFVLPNLFFHVTTAYAILRHNGIDIGKKDFLGG